MRISRRTAVPVDVESAFAVLATEDFQREKVAEVCTDVSTTVVPTSDGAVIDVERAIPTQGMPTAVATAAGERLHIAERQTWRAPEADGSRRADIAMSVRGLPLTLRGGAVLSPDDGGAVLTFEADLTCGLPFVGRKIETAAAPVVEGAFEDEAALLVSRAG